MDAVLEGILAAQKKGGFKAFVWMGDDIWLMTVIPVLTFVKGNSKIGDTLVSRFGGKNCIASVPRMCLCGKADVDNPLHRCLQIPMAYQRALNEKVTKLLVLPETSSCRPHDKRSTGASLSFLQGTSGRRKTLAHQNDIVWTLFDQLSTIFILFCIILIW
jgi:hypothetical protein